MEIEKFDYHFKIRSSNDEALNIAVIYKNLAYSNFDTNKLDKMFNIEKSKLKCANCLQYLQQQVSERYSKCGDKLDNLCQQLQAKWQAYSNKYFDTISKVLKVKINADVINHTFCFLQLTPVNEIDLSDNIIYLDANKNADEIFKNFIIQLTKLLLLIRWNLNTKWQFNTDFETKNKIFIFVDIAIDAIFANSALRDICQKPSYEFFYNSMDNNQNVMDKFKDLYNKVDLEDFLDEVYLFVYKNYQKLATFKHFLY